MSGANPWVNGPLIDQGNVAITGGSINLDAGTVSTPTLMWAGDSTSGVYRNAANQFTFTYSGTNTFTYGATLLRMRAAASLQWGSGDSTSASDTTFGRQSAGLPVVNGATATPAGGAATMGLVFGSTAGFGIYIGSGVPTLSAAQGSLYLRSDGSTTATRLYVNTNGTTGWTNVTTAT